MKKLLLSTLMALSPLYAFAQNTDPCISGSPENLASLNGQNNYVAGGGKTNLATVDGKQINTGNISIGVFSSAGGWNSIAGGTQANAQGMGASAQGASANASADNATAVGFIAQATKCSATAIGSYSKATARFATATGQGAEASGEGATATGTFAKGRGNYSVASGIGAEANGNGAIATGWGAKASGKDSEALGRNAEANHDNSVALGAWSKTTRPNEVNVGNRTIGGVQNGTLMNDAVNLGQMRAGDEWTLNEANRYTDRAIAGIDGRINRVGALNTAMTMMASSAATIPGKNKLAWGTGYYNGKVALAIGYQRLMYTKHSKMPYAITAGASFTSGARTMGVGMGFGF